MELKSFWTDNALSQIETIFDYYKYIASIEVARKIVTEIVDSSILLEKTPLLGKEEPLLIHRKNKYRSLVVGKYKLIYWIDVDVIKIAVVFDCLQNPIKLNKID